MQPAAPISNPAVPVGGSAFGSLSVGAPGDPVGGGSFGGFNGGGS
jgi:hypothetical protein